MNTNARNDAKNLQMADDEVVKLLDALELPKNKFSAANIEYDNQNTQYIESYKYTATTAAILSQLALASQSPLGSTKSFVLSGPYGTGKSHLLLQYMSLISGDFPKITESIISALSQYENIPEVNSLLSALKNKSLPRLLPVVVKSGLSTLRSTLAISLQQTLETHGLSHLMPQIYGEEAVAVIERWQTGFPQTFAAFSAGLRSDDSVQEYMNRLRKLDENTWTDFNKRYQQLTAGSKFTPQNTAEPQALYASVLSSLKDSSYDGIVLLFDEFSKYLETGVGRKEESEPKLLQDLAEYATRTAYGKTPILNFVLVTHKDISNYLNHLPKNLLDGWRAVAERFTNLHMPQNLEQTSLLLGGATGNHVPSVSSWIDENEDLFIQESETLDVSLRSIVSPTFAKRVFPLHAFSTYLLIRLSELIGQNERSVYAFMSDTGSACYSECLQIAKAEHRLLLTPEIAFDYFENRIREQIYDQDFSNIYELYSKAALEARELKLSDDDTSIALRIIKTITLCELMHIESITQNIITSIFEVGASIKNVDDIINKLLKAEIISVYVVDNTIKLSRPDTASADKLLSQKMGELEKMHISDAELWQQVTAPNLIFYPQVYNDENRLTRYFRVSFIEYSDFKAERFAFVKRKEEYPGTDGFVYFVLGVDNNEILTDELLPIIQKSGVDNDFVNVVAPLSGAVTSPQIRQQLLTLRALNLIKNAKVKPEQSVQNVLDIIESQTIQKLGDVSEILTSREQIKDGSYGPKTCYGSFAGLSSVRVFRYQFQASSAFNELLSELCSKAYDAYPIFNNEMTVCTTPSGISKNAIKDIMRALLEKPGARFKNFKPASQQMTIIRSILERPQFIKLTENWQDFELGAGNAETEPLIEFIRKWFAESQKERNLRQLVNALSSVKNSFGLKLGIIPLVITASILSDVSSIAIINKKQQNTEFEFSAEMFISMFDSDESIDNYKIRYRKVDQFNINLRKALATVFMPNFNLNLGEIPPLDKVANAINDWFLMLPKFSRKTIFMPSKILGVSTANGASTENTLYDILLSACCNDCTENPVALGISEQSINGFVRKVAAFALVTPRRRYYEEMPSILNIPRSASYEDLVKVLRVIKEFVDHSIDYLYVVMSSIVTSNWEQGAPDLKTVVNQYAAKLKCADVSHRLLHKNDVLYVINSVQSEFNEHSFLKGLAKEITKLDPKEWDVGQFQNFVNEVQYLGGEYLSSNEHNMQRFHGDLAQMSVSELRTLLEPVNGENKGSKDYIERDLKALFNHYNLDDRSIVLTLLKLVEQKLHP